MAPSTATYRPMVTPTRSVLAIAAVALASSVCMAIGDPFAATIPTATMAVAAMDCDDTGADRGRGESALQAARPRPLVQ